MVRKYDGPERRQIDIVRLVKHLAAGLAAAGVIYGTLSGAAKAVVSQTFATKADVKAQIEAYDTLEQERLRRIAAEISSQVTRDILAALSEGQTRRRHG